MSHLNRIHTPLYASQPTGRRSISRQKHVVESVLPDMVVEKIRTTQFDVMLASGFAHFPGGRISVTTIKLTLTPTNARDNTRPSRQSCLHFC
ncbi:hypothetical protein DSO57_1003494 [Entomophthora muscae]|uniref:Uncharacterized protein n=1 Tax=Entomophthora muscae TaxID=34485 RepID=A0ACC2RN87_9FUNG|nr:hypothetical protein DSO57_1003494 [Entomophthora muscae]